MSIHSPIGGFFELHEPDGCSADLSILEFWTNRRPYAAYVNARSAFAALVHGFPEATVWLPAFICPDLIHPSYKDRVRFFGMHHVIEPDLAIVAAKAKPGDIVLIAAFFGYPVSRDTRDFVAQHRELRFVEDRAQTIDAGPECGANWVLYSPRKLLGVADGGLLVARDSDALLPQPTSRPDSGSLWSAPLLRYEDPTGQDNVSWYMANQQREGGMVAGHDTITRLSLSILSHTSLESLAAPRLRNWRRLDERLRGLSAVPDASSPAPFGYLLQLESTRRDVVLTALHAARIFAAVHWRKIPAPASQFPREARWSQELMTLPCDQRYDVSAMDRIADCVVETLR